MEITVRNMTLALFRANGKVDQSMTTIVGDDEHVQWTAEQYAEVNECGVTIEDDEGNIIGKAGNVQS